MEPSTVANNITYKTLQCCMECAKFGRGLSGAHFSWCLFRFIGFHISLIKIRMIYRDQEWCANLIWWVEGKRRRRRDKKGSEDDGDGLDKG